MLQWNIILILFFHIFINIVENTHFKKNVKGQEITLEVLNSGI
jgi:hypothetical protein